jgi:uncharacterized glyoxalase superfamily protein PhnB
MEDTGSAAHQTITPYFTVENADRFIAFAIAAFGARLVRDTRDQDNRVQHARLRIGTSLIMINDSSQSYPANISQMHLYVEDADQAYQSALDLWACALMPPNDRPHGDRMAGIKDPCGNIWWLASRKP